MNLTVKRIVITIIASAVFNFYVPVCRAADPEPVTPGAPSPLPSFPASFAAFTPTFSTTAPTSSAPVCAEWTRSAGPGDTIMLTGGQFSSYSTASVGRDTRFKVYGQSGAQGVTVEANIQRLANDQVAVTLPASLPTNSMYWIWPQNAAGTGRPAVLNRTEAWWVGPNQTSPGQTISVFGRNLGGGTSIYLQGSSGSGQWLTAQSSNGYKADFALPAGLSIGSYQVWAHNGLGGKYGWARPLALTVSAPTAWSSTQFNVKTLGAQGNGVADDTAAISSAINQARNTPGSTVYFPAGTYLLNDTLGGGFSNVRLLGAGKGVSKILAKPGFVGQYGMFVGTAYSNVEVTGLTFDTGGNMGGALGNTIFQIRDSSNVRFTDVRFTQEHDTTASLKSAVDFTGGDHFYFDNCDFIEENCAFVGNARQVFFNQCAFYGINDCNALLYIWGGSQISLTNSTAADFNASDVRSNGNGWAQGRWISGRGGDCGSPNNIYFAGNTTTDMAVRPVSTVDQNTGEQFMFEGLDVASRGQATGATSTSVSLASGAAPANQVATIVAGKGIGQSRLITGGSSGNYTVNEPWNVVPDGTSTVSVGGYMTQVAVVNNTFDGKAATIGSLTASAGVEPFGGCSNIVVTGNTFHDLRYGISNWSLTNKTSENQGALGPNFFNDFSGNTFSNCRYGFLSSVANENQNYVSDIALLGNTVRRNQIAANEDGISFSSYGLPSSGSTVAMNIYQGNTVTAKRTWVSDQYSGISNQVVVSNQMNWSGTVGAALSISQKPALRENTWSPSTSPYSGTPTGILELPKRTIHLDLPAGSPSTPGSFTVWNSGTGALAWSASTSTSWLQLSNTSGSIANENSLGTLGFVVNPSGLTTGDYEGIIAVTGGGSTQQVTVSISVTSSTSYGNGTGLTGSYYTGLNFNTLIKSQIDPRVDFNWGSGNPNNLDGSSMSSIGNDTFSVQWKGQIQAIESGTYTFTTTSDDGARLWIGDINGTPLIDKWINQGVSPWSGTISLSAGQKYNIRMDYFEDAGLAEAHLSWLRPGASAAQIIPQSQLYPTLGTAGGSGTITREVWTGYDGNDVSAIPLTATPNIVDTLTSLEEPTDWADRYGTRLRGTITAPISGTYTFWIAGDDATELWLGTSSSASSKVKIAYNTNWTSSREWNKYTTQKSVGISLVAGQKYYVEVLHKEGSAGDNLAVGWLKPGETGTVPSEVIPGSVLSPFLKTWSELTLIQPWPCWHFQANCENPSMTRVLFSPVPMAYENRFKKLFAGKCLKKLRFGYID